MSALVLQIIRGLHPNSVLPLMVVLLQISLHLNSVLPLKVVQVTDLLLVIRIETIITFLDQGREIIQDHLDPFLLMILTLPDHTLIKLRLSLEEIIILDVLLLLVLLVDHHQEDTLSLARLNLLVHKLTNLLQKK
jgi:hypothetical protein